MAGDKYLELDLTYGVPKQKASIQTSAGAVDAGKIPALDASGLISTTMLPNVNTVTATATEACNAGAMISLLNTNQFRNASRTSIALKANGFIVGSVASGATAVINLGDGINTGVTGLTPGADYFLSTGGGVMTQIASGGDIVQFVGKAKSAAELEVILGDPIITA